jgi:large subunit ribosomal protein L24
MKIKKGDTVVVIAGKNKGQTGKVMRTMPKVSKIVVEDVNKVTRHVKKTKDKPGQKIKFEAPINSSNVMLVDPKTKKRSRIGYKKAEKGKKERISKNSKTVI